MSQTDPVADTSLVLTASRAKWLMITGLCAVFVAVGVAMVADGNGAGWLGVVFFGLCGLVGASQIVRPGRLVLGDDAFEVVSFRRVRRYELAQCGEFSVWHNPRGGNRLVVFDHEPDVDTAMGQANAALTGASTGLGDTFGTSAHQLADLLNDARRRRLGHE